MTTRRVSNKKERGNVLLYLIVTNNQKTRNVFHDSTEKNLGFLGTLSSKLVPENLTFCPNPSNSDFNGNSPRYCLTQTYTRICVTDENSPNITKPNRIIESMQDITIPIPIMSSR